MYFFGGLLVEAPVEAEFEGAGLDWVVGGEVVAFAEEVLGDVVDFDEKTECANVGGNVGIQNWSVVYFRIVWRSYKTTDYICKSTGYHIIPYRRIRIAIPHVYTHLCI